MLKNVIKVVKELRMAKDDSSVAKAAVTGAVLGAAVGVTAGVLFAPKSGKETRAQIKATTKDLKNKAGDKIENIKEETKDTIGKVVDKTKAAIREGTQAAKEA